MRSLRSVRVSQMFPYDRTTLCSVFCIVSNSSTTSFPCIRLLNIVLLLVWRNIPMHVVYRIQHATLRMTVMVVGSILAWGIMAVAMRFIIVGLEKVKVIVHYPALVAFAIQVFVAMIVTVFGERYTAKGEGKVKWKLYAMAGVLGFATGIGLVFLSDVDDTSGGLLLSFPVILIVSVSSLASTYAESLPTTATTAMIGGSVSTSLYAILFAESLPLFDRLFQQSEDPNLAFKPASIAIATIVCWFACLLVISLPILFILRCLARREKGTIEKVRWYEGGEGSDAIDPQTALTTGWQETFGFDDDDEENNDGLSNTDFSSISSTEGTTNPPSFRTRDTTSLLSKDSFSRPTPHSVSDNAARRALLEESLNDASPIILAPVSIPDSPVPPGSSRLASFSATSRSKR